MGYPRIRISSGVISLTVEAQWDGVFFVMVICFDFDGLTAARMGSFDDDAYRRRESREYP
jgi:hypothetical protein